jgi:hypothetical protein
LYLDGFFWPDGSEKSSISFSPETQTSAMPRKKKQYSGETSGCTQFTKFMAEPQPLKKISIAITFIYSKKIYMTADNIETTARKRLPEHEALVGRKVTKEKTSSLQYLRGDALTNAKATQKHMTEHADSSRGTCDKVFEE